MMLRAAIRFSPLKAGQLVGCRWLGGLMGTLAMAAANAASDDAETKPGAEAVIELTRSQSRIEIGAGSLSQGSFAAGNYNGLNKQGGYAIGNFDLRGSQYSYGNEHDDKTRWYLGGTNLGLRLRSLEGEYGRQDFSNSTRLTLSASHGRMTQNQTFLPYTINPGLTSTVLPRSSLHGLVDTTFFNAKLSLRPVRGLSVNASLRYENRDNKTPMSLYGCLSDGAG